MALNTPQATSTHTAPDAKATVLFVDDEARILRSLKMLFRGQYNIRFTTDAGQALEILKNETVHVLVSDQRMPRMSGVQLLRAAKEISPNTMRLLLTGYADMGAIIGSVNEGEIFRYIEKPWDTQAIQEKVALAAGIALKLSAVAPSAYRAGDAPGGTGVLVIDEDSRTHNIVRDAADNADQVYYVANIEQALDVLSMQDIGVVISELRFSEGNAEGIIKALKRAKSDLLCIVVTSFKDTTALIELINEGQVFRFLPKPLTPALLSRSLQGAKQQLRAQQITPALLQRHVVDTPKQETEVRVSNKIMDYLSRIRRRNRDGRLNA